MFGTRDPVVSIEIIPFDDEVFNLSVDQDETFVLSGIVTHNCLCYMTAVDMDTDDFVDNLSSWVKGGSWEDMDRYAAKYGPGMDPPIAPLTTGGGIGSAGIAIAAGTAAANAVYGLLTPDGVQNIDALDDWLGADEEVLDRRMGWDEEGDE
jgi:hypothetical protein